MTLEYFKKPTRIKKVLEKRKHLSNQMMIKFALKLRPSVVAILMRPSVVAILMGVVVVREE